jgi:hypothetical protein
MEEAYVSTMLAAAHLTPSESPTPQSRTTRLGAFRPMEVNEKKKIGHYSLTLLQNFAKSCHGMTFGLPTLQVGYTGLESRSSSRARASRAIPRQNLAGVCMSNWTAPWALPTPQSSTTMRPDRGDRSTEMEVKKLQISGTTKKNSRRTCADILLRSYCTLTFGLPLCRRHKRGITSQSQRRGLARREQHCGKIWSRDKCD